MCIVRLKLQECFAFVFKKNILFIFFTYMIGKQSLHNYTSFSEIPLEYNPISRISSYICYSKYVKSGQNSKYMHLLKCLVNMHRYRFCTFYCNIYTSKYTRNYNDEQYTIFTTTIHYCQFSHGTRIKILKMYLHAIYTLKCWQCTE